MDTTFAAGTVIASTWLNDVNDWTYAPIYAIVSGVPTAYASLDAAVTGISTTRCTVVVRGDITMAASATFPTTATVKIENKARITTTGFTLTINGKAELHDEQCFVGTGTVVFGVGACKQLRPQHFGAVANGSTSDTVAIQATFTAAAAGSVPEVFFPSGTYLVTNPNTEDQATCAIVIDGLKRCRIRGEKSTKFTVSDAGAGVDEFGIFLVQQCEDLEFCYFEMDGSGIVNTGANANRSFSIVLANFDLSTPYSDNAAFNKRMEFHHLYIHDIGGGPYVLHRSQSLAIAPRTDGLSVHDCEIKNLPSVNHGVVTPNTRNVDIYNNKFIQDLTAITPVDCYAVDATAGSENVSIRNNYIYGFTFGLKCESYTNVGPASNETRPSIRVVFENNYLEEIGDPDSLSVGGGNTVGIRANGIDTVIRNNTIKARTVDLTTGGLNAGIEIVNTHVTASHCVVEGNRVVGAEYGVIHNDATISTRECSVVIRSNKFETCQLYGASIEGNCTFDDNVVLSSVNSAVEIVTSNMTFIRNNRFIDCSSEDNAIVPERVAGVYQTTNGAIGGYTEIVDNVITDSRGGSAAEYGYFLRGASTFTNPMVFRPGYTTGLVTAVAYDSNFNIHGDTNMVTAINRPGPRTFLTTNNPSSTAPWSTLAWNTGDTGMLFPPVAGSAKGWVCTVAGTPGTWVSLGNL